MTIAPNPYDSQAQDERLHVVDGTYNFRDTGGYPAEGGQTRWGKLFRSDALHRLTDDSREVLADLGIRRIVDLRDEAELLSMPSRIDGLGIPVVHEPIFPEDPDLRVKAGVTLDELYREIVTEFGESLTAAVRHIARSGTEPVLVHCTAGKDRTGIVIALTLSAAGVDRDAVIADYAATEANLAGEWTGVMIERMSQTGVEITPDIEAVVSASPARLMAETLAFVDTTYGSVRTYLVAHGLGHRDLDLLQSALVEPTTAMSTTGMETE